MSQNTLRTLHLFSNCGPKINNSSFKTSFFNDSFCPRVMSAGLIRLVRVKEVKKHRLVSGLEIASKYLIHI